MRKKAKKLKKVSVELISYITIETEVIKDANDKMMNIVPQSKVYLEMVRDQLMACHKSIMSVKIKNLNDRPLIDIKYPKGYE